MIDIENLVFTRIANVVRSAFPGTACYGEFVETPASFPCVTVVESDNRVYEPTRTLDNVENHAVLTYDINVFTNDSSGKKSKAKAISDVIDREMESSLFTRIYRGQTPNIDRSVYRITLRYRVVVSKGIIDGDSTIFTAFTTR